MVEQSLGQPAPSDVQVWQSHLRLRGHCRHLLATGHCDHPPSGQKGGGAPQGADGLFSKGEMSLGESGASTWSRSI